MIFCNDEHKHGYIMTETILAGEQIKKFSFDDIFTLKATLNTIIFQL